MVSCLSYVSSHLFLIPPLARVDSKVSKVPRRPFEAERLDQEMKLIGEYGLKNKREIWRIGFLLSNIRRAARELLTLEEKGEHLFERACEAEAFERWSRWNEA